jgi:hypothetical protein
MTARVAGGRVRIQRDQAHPIGARRDLEAVTLAIVTVLVLFVLSAALDTRPW